MDVIVPQYIKSPSLSVSGYATLVSVQLGAGSPLPEPSTGIWSISATYAADDVVYFMPTTGRDIGIWKTYKAIIGSTGAEPPEYGVDENWVDQGAIEKYKAFDYYSNTVLETDAMSATIQFTCKNITSLALINTQCYSVHITGWQTGTPGTVLIDELISIYQPTTSFFSWFFDDFEYSRNITIPDNDSISLYSSLTIQIAFTGISGVPIKCGAIIPGRRYNVGKSLYGIVTGIKDYSKKVVDDVTGDKYLQVGNYTDKMSCDLRVDNINKNIVNSILRQLRATPTVWQGNQGGTEYDDILIYGNISEFSIVHKGTNYSEVSLEIEGLI